MVLLVDDNRELCEALTEFLSLQGHAVQSAANGIEALRLLACGLSGSSGVHSSGRGDAGTRWLGVSRRAGQASASCRRPGRDHVGMCDVAQKVKEAGAVGVVRKPVEPQTLLRLIEHFGERV